MAQELKIPDVAGHPTVDQEVAYEGARDPDGWADPVWITWLGRRVKRLPLEPSQAIANHSPDGFEWGYGGSGPAQLALAIMLDCGFRRSQVVALYHRFCHQVIARQVAEGGGPGPLKITKAQVKEWARLELSVPTVQERITQLDELEEARP